VERARLEPDDPRQSELEARELRLLKRHAADWCGSHFLFKKVRFRRGFIEYVHLHLQHFLHHRRQILDLEPIRDVSLTGWMRATDDLVRRVAACEEWNEIETLRLHNQGPHKWPRSNVVILIESPHLTRLKSLRLPSLELDAEARRRIERAPLLGRIEELSLPSLNTYASNPGPGPWLSEGGRDVAWENLRTLRINDGYLRPEFIAQLSDMPFWNRLRSLAVPLPYHQTNDVLVRLRDRLPPSLEELRLVANHSPVQLPDGDSFFSLLAESTRLQALLLQWVPISPAGLASFFRRSCPCELYTLVLDGCRLTGEHVRVLSDSDRTRGLVSLRLHEYPGLPANEVKALVASGRLREAVELSLSLSSQKWAELEALAEASFGRLRSLSVGVSGVPRPFLQRLLASPGLRNLVRLKITDSALTMVIDRGLAEQLVRLPSLASVGLDVGKLEVDAREILESNDSLAWSVVRAQNDPASFEVPPNRLAPLDEDLAELDRGS
jgi:hypothetical protein